MAQALNRIDPMNEPVIRDMADLGAALGRTQEAVKAYIDLSHRLRARNDLSGALEDLVRAERLDTRRADILHLQIDLLETLKGPEAALQKRREYLIRLKAQEQENLESVIAAFEEFLADHPQDPLILRELAEVYARIGNLTESTARFRRLLEGAEKRGDLEEIVEIRQVILRLEPDDPFANANLALALDEVGDHTRAVEMYARAAQLYLKMGAVELAELQLNRGIELDPENPAILDLIISIQRQQGNIAAVREGLWKLSQVLRKAERYDAATARLVELRTLAPEWIEPLRALAETQEILNDTLQAVSTYMELARRLESEGVPKEAMRIYAHICNNLRFDVDALREWSRLAEDIGTDSERRDVYLRYAQAMIEMRQWNDARRALAKVDSLVPDGTATAALREKLGIGLADDPLSSGLELRQAALGYRILGQIDEAMRCLRLAIERMPDDPEACGILSELLASENQVAESIRYRFAQIRGLLHRGDAGPEVEQLIKATCKVLTESAGDLITLAKTLVDGGRRDLAIPIFEQAVKLAEDDFVTVLQATDSDIESTQSSPVLRHAHITALVELGSATDAAEWCRETAARLQNLGDREGSLDMALSLVELLPSDPQSHVTLGQAFLALDKNSEAHDAFLKATELVSGPNGDPQAASEYLNLAVTADSSRPESRTALARLLADLGQTKEAADAWYHAARLYFQNGDVDSAESALLESTKLQPRAVDAIRLLAEIRRQRDGFPAALPVYRSYLTLIQETSAEAQIEKAFREVAAIEEQWLGALTMARKSISLSRNCAKTTAKLGPRPSSIILWPQLCSPRTAMPFFLKRSPPFTNEIRSCSLPQRLSVRLPACTKWGIASAKP
jgi:tetratricopeptide (TPR) repeat protein